MLRVVVDSGSLAAQPRPCTNNWCALLSCSCERRHAHPDLRTATCQLITAGSKICCYDVPSSPLPYVPGVPLTWYYNGTSGISQRQETANGTVVFVGVEQVCVTILLGGSGNYSVFGGGFGGSGPAQGLQNCQTICSAVDSELSAPPNDSQALSLLPSRALVTTVQTPVTKLRCPITLRT